MAGFVDGSTELPTPCLVADPDALDANIAALAEVLPGRRVRPHVKAFKCTQLAHRLAANGHTAFTCATLGEIEGMLAAGLGEDLLLANETLDVDRLRRVTGQPGRVTVAVDSAETIKAASAGNVREVLIDVNVGLPRCGCAPANAGQLADEARLAGLTVRGVMGYEGHLMMVEGRVERERQVAASMELLADAAEAVGGEVISAGGTGTFDLNHLATEIQAGSYVFMDTQYSTLGLPFVQSLLVEATVISVNRPGGYLVADAGLKSLGMDHGDPFWPHGDVWFCSDEHITLAPAEPARWQVGDRIRLVPAHIDPTVAKHERLWLLDERGPKVWPIDLRHW